ncbi:alpha/beta hydrolase [Actinomyces sp. W5033]|uniref:alpha/beta hydrolase n=1 Tax=Actinomyces sp. W5033 TaxID=3446479 RepID=UPI003EE3FDFE
MTPNSYTRFLPQGLRCAARLTPESTWWQWRRHDVHLARARRPESPARVIVVHGAGGHSGALWPLAALVAHRGVDVCAVDLPLYGRTRSPDPAAVRYGHWVDLLVELVEVERDHRPLVLWGASIGGLLAYEVAARSPHVAAVAATCLLDPGDWRARARMTRVGGLGLLGGPLSGLVAGAAARTMVPMSAVADLGRMSRDPALSRLCAIDPRGGGARVPLGFLASYLRFAHTPPEHNRTPVTLVHPARDAWTPLDLSARVLARAAGPATLVVLRECGHFPIEDPGLSDLVDVVVGLARGQGAAVRPSARGPQ